MTILYHVSGTLLFAVVGSVLGNPGYDPGYYLHFPPIPYNSINFNGPPPPQFPPWLLQNQNQNQTNPGGTIPTVKTLNVNSHPVGVNAPPPGINSSPQVLHNGTLVYYVTGPWGGIKAVPVNPNIDNTITTTPPNWSSFPAILQPPEFAYLNQQRQQQLQQQISSPNPNDQWNNPNFGWGPYYGDPSVTTQNPMGSSTPGTKDRPTTTGTTTTTSKATTSATPSIATTASPSAKDSLAKFRQIVTRIREITRQELKS